MKNESKDPIPLSTGQSNKFQKSSTEVTLVVIYYNEEKNLPTLLDSFEYIKGTGLTEQFQFLFIDNNSQDQSSKIVESWIESKPWLKAKNLNRQKNQMASARQQALNQVQTPWLCFVDSDVILASDWFEKAIKSISFADSKTAVIGGQSQYLVHHKWQSFILPLANYFPLGKNKDHEVPHVPTNNYLLKKNTALEVGGFDPFFDRVGEDMDINVRLRKKYKIIYDPLFSVKHKAPESILDWYYKMILYGRAQSFVFLKYFGEVSWEKCLPAVAVFLVSTTLCLFPKSLILLVVFLLIPRSQFYLLSFVFYGLGEWVGLFIGLWDKIAKNQKEVP